jgi:threonine aldolase
LEAINAEAARFGAAYGLDSSAVALESRLAEVFERPVHVFPVVTGTAANSIAIAATNPVWGCVMCHELAHIQVDECAAPTVISGGVTLDPVGSPHGKLTPERLQERIDERRNSGVHTTALSGLSLTQATEAGTVYTASELADLCGFARANKMSVHMDGARFANAVASTAASPAELTWKAGVDIMSFGATKGGALAAEAVVVFSDVDGETVERYRKRSGHLLSKQRMFTAQMLGWLDDGAWLRHAAHANRLAAQLGDGLIAAGIALVHDVQANMVFAHLDPDTHSALESAGANFYPEARSGDLVEARFVLSWSSSGSDVENLLAQLPKVSPPA